MSRRCSVHGLMASEDGRCVICRRGDETAERGDSPTSVTSLLWTAVAGFLCLALVIGYWKYSDKQEAKRAEVPVVADQGQAPAPVQTQVAPPVEGTRTEPGGAILGEPEENPTAQPMVDATGAPSQALEVAKRAVPIKLYSTSWCPHCKRARTFLTQQGYTFEDHDVEASETDKALLRSMNPSGSVPTFDLGGHVLVGFDPQTFDTQMTRIAEAQLKKADAPRR